MTTIGRCRPDGHRGRMESIARCNAAMTTVDAVPLLMQERHRDTPIASAFWFATSAIAPPATSSQRLFDRTIWVFTGSGPRAHLGTARETADPECFVSTDMFALSELGVAHVALLGKESWAIDTCSARCRGSCPRPVRRGAADRAGRPLRASAALLISGRLAASAPRGRSRATCRTTSLSNRCGTPPDHRG